MGVREKARAETETDRTRRTNGQTQGGISIPIPHGKQTEKIKVRNRGPRITRVYRLIGVEFIGTGGRAISTGPEIRVGAKTRGRRPKERVVSLKAKSKTRG